MGRAGYRISWTMPAACMTARANSRGGGTVEQLELYAGECPNETDLMEVLDPADGFIEYTMSEWIELFPQSRLCVVARGVNGVVLARCDWCVEKDGVEPPPSPSPSPSPSPEDPDPPERWWPCEITDVFSSYAEVSLPGYDSNDSGMGLNGAVFDGVFTFSVTTNVQVFAPTSEEGHIRTYIKFSPGYTYSVPPGPSGGGGSQYIDEWYFDSAAGGDAPVPGDGLVEFTKSLVLPYIPDSVTVRTFYVVPPNTAASCVCPSLALPSLRCNDVGDDRSIWVETIPVTV